MNTIEIEICVDNAQSLHNAVMAGADRIELCSALELGGLSPSPGFIRAAAKVSVPVYAMIRPRSGDFEFTNAEVNQMIDDIGMCRDAGLAGVVVGASSGGRLDETTLKALVDAAGDLGVTLHRVFDLIDDPALAIETATGLGIERILTSGGAQTALEGADTIRRCVEYANGRLSIMAGGGVHAGNAKDIVRRTGVREIHGSFSGESRTYAASVRELGFSAASAQRETNIALVHNVRSVLGGS